MSVATVIAGKSVQGLAIAGPIFVNVTEDIEMEKKSLLGGKPSAVFIDIVVTVCKMMTYDDFVNATKDMPHVNVNCNQEVDGVVGYSVTTYRNGVESEPVKWTTSPTGTTVGRKSGLAFSEALSASRLGMFVARKAWNESGIAMMPIDVTWPIETKGLPPLWARTKNKCNMPLNLNVPDFIASDWYIVDERPAMAHHFGFADFAGEMHGGFPYGQMNDMMRDAVMDRGNSKELHAKIVNDILKLEHKLARNRRQEYPQERYSVKMAAADKSVNATDIEKPDSTDVIHKTPLAPFESQLGYPSKDATDNLTLDQRLNERARIQRESGM